MKLKLDLISDIRISEETLLPFVKELGGRKMLFPVYRTEFERKTFYIAFSGGNLRDGELHLTEVGKVAFEGLTSLRTPSKEFCIRELKGKTVAEVWQKIETVLKEMRNHCSILFLGDMAGELDEPLAKIMSITGTIESKKFKYRSAIPLRLRFSVLKRDNYRCKICGRSAADGVTLEVDHILAKSKGGSDELNNLQTLCFDCNRGKNKEDI